MKSLSLCLTFIFFAFSVALPASFGDFSTFSSQDSIVITELVESEDDQNESEEDDDSSRVELFEEEVIIQDGQIRLFGSELSFHNFDYRKVYIPSYMQSIYVPPLV